MKVTIEIPDSIRVTFEILGKSVYQEDIELALRLMCISSGISYDGVVEYISEDIIQEAVDEAREEWETLKDME